MVKNNKAAVTEVIFQWQRHAKEDVFTQESFRIRIDFLPLGKCWQTRAIPAILASYHGYAGHQETWQEVC